MSLLVVGSIAYDDIRTPHGEVKGALGGSAVYFSLAATLFTPVRLVGVVGDDFPSEHLDLLQSRGVDLEGLEVVSGGRTFRWSGLYHEDMNQRDTLSVDLNVLEDFQPKVPRAFCDSQYVFLANGPCTTQISVLDQLDRPQFVMADTMDLWIRTQREDLLRLLRRVDGLVLNDSEVELLTGSRNLVEAGSSLLELGPSRIVLKKGEHGVLMCTRNRVVPLPAYPVSQVRDPTGAGDSFAGALMGYLASVGSTGDDVLKQAVVHGAVAASFTVEGFGTEKLAQVDQSEARQRFESLRDSLRL